MRAHAHLGSSYRFKVYKAPKAKRDDRVRPASGIVLRIQACIQELVKQLTPPPPEPDQEGRHRWCCELKQELRDLIVESGGYDCQLLAALSRVVCPDPQQFPNNPAGFDQALMNAFLDMMFTGGWRNERLHGFPSRTGETVRRMPGPETRTDRHWPVAQVPGAPGSTANVVLHDRSRRLRPQAVARLRPLTLEEQLSASVMVKTAGEALILAAEAIEAGKWFSLRPLAFGHSEFRVRDDVWLEGVKDRV